MALYRLVNYSVSHICLMCFILAFTKWRYSQRKTVGIAVISTMMLIGLEWIRYVNVGMEFRQQSLFTVQSVLILATSLYLSQYRDFRGLFTGLAGRDYVLCGTLVARCLYVSEGKLLLSAAAGVAINVLTLIWMIRCFRPYYMEFQLINRREWIELCLIPAGFYLARIFLRPFLKEPGLEQVVASISLMGLMYVSYILMFRLVSKIAREERIQRERDMLESSIKALKRSMEEVHAAEQRIAIQNHDRRHRVRTVQGLMEKGDYDAIRSLLNDMEKAPEQPVASHYCDNLPVNGIVSSYVALARQRQVQTYVTLDIPAKLSVNEWELAVVVGNLLENAIDAAGDVENPEQRILWMTAKSVRGQLLLEVLNTFHGSPVFDEDTLLPISSRGGGHGLGLPSVVYFAEHNGAVFDCGIENDRFFARLLI